MKLKQSLKQGLVIGGLILAATLVTHSAHANVYATNIKLNGSATNVLAAAGDSVTISYILNEPASLGVTIQVLSGTTVVRSLNVTNNGAGTQAGLNSVVWDGKDANSNYVAPGAYAVRITAASSGYTAWTQTTVDGDATYVWSGRGIAVDQNPNSLYYGRIFVANSDVGPSPDLRAGDVVGVLKMNADASPADEGILSTGQDGHAWTGNFVSPWKLTVSADDYVYVDDLVNAGEVYRWDPTFSSNALLYVLQTNNQPSGAQLSGPAVAGSGTNTEIWMADSFSTDGTLKWGVTSNGTCAANDKGATVVGLGTNHSFSAVALDKYGNIYTCQSISAAGDSSPRVFRYPAYDPSTNANVAETNPAWAVGAGDDTYGGANGISVDPTGTYVAVCFEGVGSLLPDNGNIKILYATNGAAVANLDLGISMDNQPYTEHQNTDCAWDAVGNVYYIDDWYGYWRAFSPPGTNQATTVAVMQVLVQPPAPPVITGFSVTNGTVTLFFTGSASDTVTSLSVVSAAVVTGGYSPVAASNITQVSPGHFSATFPANGPARFYRIQR
jgi:hypothetical protein